MRAEYDVLIIGAGVGGAALALALAKWQLRVLVVDRRSGPGNVNRGDSLLPAVTRQLGAWGALDALKGAGARSVAKMQVFHDGARVYEAPLGSASDDAPYLVLPHPEIERVLLDVARATGYVDVRYRRRMTRLIEQHNRVCGAVLTDQTDDEESVYASLVVGADGSSSTVRAALAIAFEREPYDHSFYIVDVDRPADYEDAMRVELHPDGGVLVVPQGRDRVGLGVLVRSRQTELFRAGSLDTKMAAIAHRSPLLRGCTPVPQGAHLYMLARAHAPHYFARGAVLLGDAIHVTNPTVGQGMTMAIEDASALAQHLGPGLAAGLRGPPLDELLRAYERARWPRNERLIRWSHWLSLLYSAHGPLGDPLVRGLLRIGGSPIGRHVHELLWSRMAARHAA